MKARLWLWLCGCAGLLAAALPYTTAVPATPADELGRLFTSPAERAEINRLRTLHRFESTAISAGGETLSAAATPRVLMRLDGRVRRGNGEEEVWLNGGRTDDTDGATDAQNRTRVRVPGTDRVVWMKPGQVFDADTGVVRESYQAGQTDRTGR